VDAEQSVSGEPLSRAEELAGTAAPGDILVAPETLRLAGGAVSAEGARLVELRADTGRTLRLDSPLVGRERQLQALRSAFANAVADRTCQLFTVLGPAGVGKSRLVAELTAGLDAAVLRGRCLPYGEGVTFWPLREAGIDAEPEEARTTFETLARSKPLVVCFDDLHWAEPAFLDLVEDVAESRGAPILLVCLARPELLDARPGWGGGRVNASSVLLEPLSDEESGRLIDNLLGPSDLPEIVRDWIVSAAEGNPLFVEEMLASLVDQEVLRPQGEGWTTVEMPALAVPPSVQALIAARIDRLPDDQRTVLELASVEGTRFHPEAVAELARGEVDTELAALVRKELLRPREGEQSFAFRHQLVRDAAYDSMPKQLRAELHERLADWLRPREGDDIADYQLEQAAGLRRDLGMSRA
jgi:predicted ATPase